MIKLFNLLFVCAVSFAQAGVINVPNDYDTIAGAVQQAADGDTILLAVVKYIQPNMIKIDKPISIASNFIFSDAVSDIDNTVIYPASKDMHLWFELSALNSRVVGITFLGSDEHTLHITTPYASVEHCKFIDGKDQLSMTNGGGYVGYCYFEGGGDDGIDCDESLSWTIEHNTIVNLFYNNPVHMSDGVILGTNNVFDADPLLNQNLSLQQNSPCIDKGCATFRHGDIQLVIPASAFFGAAPDLGAFEYGETTQRIDPSAKSKRDNG